MSDILAGIESGRFDGAILPGDSLTGPGSQLDILWGAASAAARDGRQRWFGAPLTETAYVALNPNLAAFRDADVRRAVAMALDRAALADVWPIRAVGGLLPPSIGGVPMVDAPKPDLEEALVLMAGRTITARMAAPNEGECPECDAFAAELSGQLRAIGITVEVERSEDPWAAAFRPDTSIDLIELGIGSAVPDAATFLRDLPEASWIDPASVTRIEQLLSLDGAQRTEAAAALARHVTDESNLLVPYGRGEFANYFGAGIGCAFVQPAIAAVDLLSLCRLEGPD
jgi:hypothetical protein